MNCNNYTEFFLQLIAIALSAFNEIQTKIKNIFLHIINF